MKEDYMCPPSGLQPSSGKQGSAAHPVAMSPEDRARAIIRDDSWVEEGGALGSWSIDSERLMDLIADAIKSAENEALERAAAALDKDATEYAKASQDGREWPHHREHSRRIASFSRCAAQTVRNLQHSDRVTPENTTFPRSGEAVTEGNKE